MKNTILLGIATGLIFTILAYFSFSSLANNNIVAVMPDIRDCDTSAGNFNVLRDLDTNGARFIACSRDSDTSGDRDSDTSGN